MGHPCWRLSCPSMRFIHLQRILAWAMGSGLINATQGTQPAARCLCAVHWGCAAQPFVPRIHSRRAPDHPPGSPLGLSAHGRCGFGPGSGLGCGIMGQGPRVASRILLLYLGGAVCAVGSRAEAKEPPLGRPLASWPAPALLLHNHGPATNFGPWIAARPGLAS